jgi:hypothetical protein
MMVCPEHVPRCAFHAAGYSPSEFLGDLFDDVVVGYWIDWAIRERLMHILEF